MTGRVDEFRGSTSFLIRQEVRQSEMELSDLERLNNRLYIFAVPCARETVSWRNLLLR